MILWVYNFQIPKIQQFFLSFFVKVMILHLVVTGVGDEGGGGFNIGA